VFHSCAPRCPLPDDRGCLRWPILYAGSRRPISLAATVFVPPQRSRRPRGKSNGQFDEDAPWLVALQAQTSGLSQRDGESAPHTSFFNDRTLIEWPRNRPSTLERDGAYRPVVGRKLENFRDAFSRGDQTAPCGRNAPDRAGKLAGRPRGPSLNQTAKKSKTTRHGARTWVGETP